VGRRRAKNKSGASEKAVGGREGGREGGWVEGMAGVVAWVLEREERRGEEGGCEENRERVNKQARSRKQRNANPT